MSEVLKIKFKKSNHFYEESLNNGKFLNGIALFRAQYFFAEIDYLLQDLFMHGQPIYLMRQWWAGCWLLNLYEKLAGLTGLTGDAEHQFYQ